ncbi:MAG TPA: HDIG domain-containing protein [Candidatus Dormibacteraeota bacterium]|nr:HDIG domain-containing protein [Candidatus Dormibacteraeota bacterium]
MFRGRGLADRIGSLLRRRPLPTLSLPGQWVLACVLLWTAFFGVLAAGYVPSAVPLRVGDIAPTDIVAPANLDYVDQQATEEARKRSAGMVPPVYRVDSDAQVRLTAAGSRLFALLADGSPSARARMDAVGVDDPTAAQWTTLSPETRNAVQADVLTAVAQREALGVGINDSDLSAARSKVADAIADLKLDPVAQRVATVLSGALVFRDVSVDLGATYEAQRSAMAAVAPVRITLTKGATIVHKGDLVTPGQVETLRAAGITRPALDWARLMAYAVLGLVLLALLAVPAYVFARAMLRNPRLLWLSVSLTIVGVVFAKVVPPAIVIGGTDVVSVALVPASAVGMLLAILAGVPAAVYAVLVISFASGLANPQSYPFALALFAMGLAGTLSAGALTRRSDLLRAGWIAGGVAAVIFATSDILRGASVWTSLLDAAVSLLAGLASAIETVGLLPLLEHTFHLCSPLRLIELSNTGESLLQRLLIEAPGTYVHSITVGYLAEAAARAVGADPLLARVGAYYHDIGKMKRAQYFVENQGGGPNPHDTLSPSLSSLIIIAHVEDGVKSAREHRLPENVVDIVQQHHGTSLVSFMYCKAQEEGSDKFTPLPDDFRYPGPKPQTREAALVMICDGVEASVRSIKQPTPQKIEAQVRRILDQLLHRGELDECDLTLRDLHAIEKACIQVLFGIHHQRIEYPSLPGSRNGRDPVRLPLERRRIRG